MAPLANNGIRLFPDGAASGENQFEQVAGGGRRGNRANLFAPDAALSLAILTLVYCLAMFDGWHQLFRDSDTGWHILTGETILTTHRLPDSDTYSFSRAGAPWLDWEWGADVLTGAAHRLAGPAGVAAVFAIAIAACSWLWLRLTFAAGGDLLLAFLFASPMLSTANLHWLARPHVFGWVLLLGTLWMLERQAKPIWFGVVGAIWANVHGSFFLGPLLGAVYFAGERLGDWIWDRSTARDGQQLKSIAVMSAATFLNPYGWYLHRHILDYLHDSELLSRIGEFQTFNFHVPGAGQVLLCIGIAGLGTVLSLGARRLDHFLAGVLFLAVGVRSARGLPLIALAVLPLANASIAASLRSARGLNTAIRARLESALNYSAGLRGIDAKLSGVALVPVILAAVGLLAANAQAGFPKDQFPVAAAAAVAKLPADARLLAPDKFGGYLIYCFHGQRKVFFDGRSDFYGANFMKQYIQLMEGRPGWQEQVTRWGFTHALLPNNYTLVAGLQQSGWKLQYQDATATLLAAPGR